MAAAVAGAGPARLAARAAAASAAQCRRSFRPGRARVRGTAPVRDPGAGRRRAAAAVRRRTRPRRDDGRTAGGAAGTGRQGEGVAHQRLDGSVQEAAQDVQRRRRDHLRDQDAQRQHVGRGVRVRLQRRRGARRESHDARAADRRRAAEAGRRLRHEEEDLRRLPHPRAGQHDRLRQGVRPVQGQQGQRRFRPLGRGRQRRRHADAVPGEVPRSHRQLPPEGPHHAGALLAQHRVGNRRDTDQGNPAAGEEEQVGHSRVDRARIRRARRLGRGEGSQEVRRVLPGGAERAHLADKRPGSEDPGPSSSRRV